MSTTAAAATSSNPPPGSKTGTDPTQQSTMSTASNSTTENVLRQQLRSLMQKLPPAHKLDPTYKRLLLNGIVTTRKPALPKDKFYKGIGSRLRETVDRYVMENQGKDPFDRIGQRMPLEDDKMRAALTLREFKEHEQTPLLEATLAANVTQYRQGMDEPTRRRHFEGVAIGLQTSKKPRQAGEGQLFPQAHAQASSSTTTTAAEQIEQARQAAELEHQRQEARQREEARQKRAAQEQAREAEERTQQRTPETPQQALKHYYYPIFQFLWNMEFPYLNNTNPFRMVIDRDNCASVGAPDYFSVIEKPMNLTYIQRKVDALAYESLAAFLQDVELMIKNALAYNTDPDNPYHLAAQEMQKAYKKMAKKTVAEIRKNRQ